MTNEERITMLEDKVAQLERIIEALKNLRTSEGHTLQLTGTNALLQK